jgi:hypothetical protein
MAGRLDDTDLLFKALADPSRRKLPDVLHAPRWSAPDF